MNCINHPDRPRIAFCQNCGKPLCAECARVVGSAVFDETCLAERLNASQPNYASVPPGAAAYAAPPLVPGAPNPGLALLLGFIPGVGAMYNGQYAKGIVHLIVFAILVSLSGHNGFFGLFILGWVFYQVFEAYHTAKARRDGTPLPNPFGLNDLGERLGFGKAWASPHHPFSTAETPAAAAAGSAPPSPYQAAAAADPYSATSVPSSPGGSAAYGSPYGSVPPVPPPAGAPAAWGAPTDYAAYGAVPPMPFDPRPNRFPVGAIILIGLGVLFLIGNAGWIEGFPLYRIFPFLLLGLGVWLFARRMLETGSGFADDGTPQYRLRLLRALRGSIWVFVVGLLSFLDSFRILSWGRSWPLFIIAAGVIAFLQRSAFLSAAAAAPYPAPPVSPVPPAPAHTSAVTSSSIVPVDPSPRRDEEV